MRAESGPAGQFALKGEVRDPQLKVSGEARFLAPNRFEIDYAFNASQSFPDVIGGGIQWDLKLESPSLGGRLSDPVLFDDSTGWAWQVAGGQSITVRADDPLAKVYFERNQKNTIRTFFYSDRIAAGTKIVRLTITLPEGRGRNLRPPSGTGSPTPAPGIATLWTGTRPRSTSAS